MANNLLREKCVACEGGVPPLSHAESTALLHEIDSTWILSTDGVMITRDLTFKNFRQAMAFLNRLADLAEEEGHHPDFLLHGWNQVRMTLSTHAIGGLSRNDFILAAKTDQLLQNGQQVPSGVPSAA